MHDGEVISVKRMAALMGHDIDTLDLQGITPNKLRIMLGMSLHRAVIGVLVLGVVAATGYQEVVVAATGSVGRYNIV